MQTEYVNKLKFLILKLNIGLYPKVIKKYSIMSYVFLLLYYLEASNKKFSIKNIKYLTKNFYKFNSPKLAIYSLPRSGLHLTLNILNSYLNQKHFNNKDYKYDNMGDNLVFKKDFAEYPPTLRNLVFYLSRIDDKKDMDKINEFPLSHSHHPLVYADLHEPKKTNCIVLTRNPLDCLKSQFYFYFPDKNLKNINLKSKEFKFLKKLSKKIIYFYNYWIDAKLGANEKFKNIYFIDFESLVFDKFQTTKSILLKFEDDLDEDVLREVCESFEKSKFIKTIAHESFKKTKIVSHTQKGNFNDETYKYFEGEFSKKILMSKEFFNF